MEFDAEVYKQFLLTHMPVAKLASGGKELVCRCRYCPDSDDPKHAHMYIHIPQDSQDISFYHCKKCGAKGYVTYHTLTEWGVWNDQIASMLISLYKNMKIKGVNEKHEVYNLHNTFVNTNNVSTIDKLNYINNRLGLDLSIQDCLNNKICLNLWDLLRSNYITKLTRDPEVVNQLDQNFVGFISFDNAFINLRKINDNPVYKQIDKRYINYNIFDKFDNTERFYTIPKNIDLSIPRRLCLNIAEGPFDILSVYYNLRNQSDDIYTSIAGNNYMGQIRHFIYSMKIFYLEIHLYVDNDAAGMTQGKARYIREVCAPMGIPIYIHRNALGKDFGVSKDQIKEVVERIL